MKNLFALLFLFASVSIMAQVPQKISYQAIVRNAKGELFKNSTISIRISILTEYDEVDAVFEETHIKTTNDNGLVTLEIGSGDTEKGNFSEIDWSKGNYFLKTEIDLTGGTNYSITGTSQLLSVPYALYAGKAEGAADLEELNKLRENLNENLDKVQEEITNDTEKLKQNMTADLGKLSKRMVNMEKLFYSQLSAPSIGLNAFYPLNGNANDFSGNGWDGTVNNCELINDRFGNTNNAYHFNGTANISTQFPGVSGNGDRSISFWTKIDKNETGGSCCFFGSSGNGTFFNIGVFAQPAPRVRIDIGNAYLDCPIAKAVIGEWHHYVVVFSAQFGSSLDGMKVYFDGELLSDYSGSNLNSYPVNTGTATKFTIGGREGATTQISIDDLKSYNRVLEDSEILQLYYESGEYQGQPIINDSDGNSYAVVKIGDQVWMAENLRTTRFNDGTPIPLVTDAVEWINLTSPAYCWQNNDIGNKSVYGALYTWYTVKSDKLCPSGWHVPTDAEWTILENKLGGRTVAGGKMKETGTEHWLDPNIDATNESGFNALPGGWRDGFTANYYIIGLAGMWWTSQETVPVLPYWREIYNNSGDILQKSSGDPSYGLSVRCIKNQ